MKKILFYSSVKSKKMFSIQSFYRTDIQILKDLGYRVLLSNSIIDFFLFWKYDIGFYYFYRFSFFCALIAKLCGKKNFFTGGIDYLEPSFASSFQLFVQRVFFFLCNFVSDCNIIVSSTDENNIRKLYYGHLPRKCKKSFHVIDYDKFEYKGEQKENIISTIGWMVNVDNVYRKGIDKTIYAFSVFVKKHPNYKLIIAGPNGDGSAVIMNLVKKLTLCDKVIYLGAISESEKIDLLKRSKVYSQLSIYEGFGIAAIEALAAGNIVVHSGNGGLKDGVSTFGIQVDRDNVDSIINGFELALGMTEQNHYYDAGIQHVKDKFSYQKRLHDFEHILM